MQSTRTVRRWKPIAVSLAATIAAIGTWQIATPASAAATYFVATNGSDANPGTQAAPLKTIAAAVREADSGDTIVLRGGYYHESVQVYAKELHIRSADGERAILDGSVAVDGWQSNGGRWFAAGWTRQFPRLTQPPVDPDAPLAGRPDEMYIDGRPLTQVGRLADVGPGTFFHDEGADRLWIGDDPTDRSVRAASLEWALYFNRAHNSSLRDVTVRRYATPSGSMAAIRGYADNLVFENIESWHNAYSGISVMGNNIRISNSVFRGNGYMGVHGFRTTNFTLERSGLIGNNRAGFDPFHSAAGVKLATGSNLVFRDNYVARNNGPGIWTDIGSYNIDIVGNLVEENGRSGIEVELSGQVDVVDNVALNNGEAGIWILESNHVNVYNNAAHDNVRDLYVMEGPRTSPDANDIVRWDLFRVAVHNNVVGGGGRAVDAFVQVDDWTENKSGRTMQVTSDHNAFWKPPTSKVNFLYRWARWPEPLAVSGTLAAHVASTGQDLNSIASTAQANPYAADPAVRDHRAPTGTLTGSPLPGRVAELVGLGEGTRPNVGPITIAEEITESGTPVPPPPPPPPTIPPPPPPTSVTRFAPEVMLDTNSNGQTIDNTYRRIGTWPGGSTFSTRIAGRGSVPPDAEGVMLTVTATAGSITAYACDESRPSQPTLVVPPGRGFGMTVLAVSLSNSGYVCIHTTADTHLTATATAHLDRPVTALSRTRILDMRPNGNTADGIYRRIGTWPANSVFAVPVAGRGGVPADADVASLALRIVGVEADGVVTMYPCGGSREGLPSVRVRPDRSAWLNDAVELDDNGRACIHTTAPVQLVVDAMGHLS